MAATVERLNQINSASSLRLASPIALLRTRTQGVDAEIIVDGQFEAGHVTPLYLLPEDEPALPPYTLTLARTGPDLTPQATLAVVDGLTPDPDTGFVKVFLDVTRLQPGRYALVLAGVNVKARPSQFILRIRAR
jgi:hypothetical protein